MLLINLAVLLGSWSIILDARSWQVYGAEPLENAPADSGTREKRASGPNSLGIEGASVEELARYESEILKIVRSAAENIEGSPQTSRSSQKRLMRSAPENPEETENVSTELQEILGKVARMESTLKTFETDFSHARKIWDQLRRMLQTVTGSEDCIGGSAGDDATLPTDCSDVLRSGKNISGVYKIRPATPNATAFDVYCEMDTHGGGWTVFQNRFDGLINFYQNWNTYKAGFGPLDGEFWLGLEHIYQLTNSKEYELLVELKDWDNETAFAKYDHFVLGSETEKYPISRLGSYNGTAGNGLSEHAGQKFSTWDMANGAGNCALRYIGAWWYRTCFRSHLNGPYLNGPVTDYPLDAPGLDWYLWRPRKYSMKGTRMSLRPRV